MLSQTDNRTDPIFADTNNLNTINLGLTTLCSMRCPHCSLAMPLVKRLGVARHATVEQILTDAHYLRGLRRIHLTGGEPTIHPQFALIAVSVRNWFAPQYVTIETNGAFYMRYRTLFANMFDKVFITHYEKDKVYANNPDNTEIVEQAQMDLGDKLIREAPVEHIKQHGMLPLHTGSPCSKFFNPGLPAGWYDGKLYACCVTYGIDRSLGIPVTANWREEILKLHMGCELCLYAGT